MMIRHFLALIIAMVGAIFWTACWTADANAAVILLKDGRTLEGRITEVSGVSENPARPKIPSGEIAVTPILLLDDGLRRIYIHKSQISEILEQAEPKKIRIRIWQNVAEHGAPIAHVGRSTSVVPFDQFGRRIYELIGPRGPIPVVQGITDITPIYTRVQGLRAEPRSYIWDMRIATSSIPRDTLTQILKHAVAQDDPDARLLVVKLYLQSERYGDARVELEEIVRDFPDMEGRQQEIRQLRQMGAKSVLKELKLRAKAGQHSLVQQLLDHFPAEEVAGETLQQVRDMSAKYESQKKQQTDVLALLDHHLEQVTDPIHREVAKEFLGEIKTGLSDGTKGRLSSYIRLAGDDQLTPEQKLALAISGWLVGSNQATDNFAVALSLAEVRDGVLEYLRSKDPVRRTQILEELRDMEGGNVERVAELLKRIAPPSTPPADAKLGPGFYKLTVPDLDGDEVNCYVQLPPEYDPLRTYPAIVTLNGEGYSPELQLDYWAGAPASERGRSGQAMRHGYITIAVDWQQPGQSVYEFSAREHHAVLSSYRTALRHFSVDADRVFLSGHGIGGNAAWDIGLAHPDMWAGVIPMVAESDRYCPRYWKNAEFVPWYFVMGEKDSGKIARNAREFDRYLRPKFDATIIEYQGRGFEWFNDEIQNLFEWMNGRQQRKAPKEFECYTMRPWDNFFWWLELGEMPVKTMVDPINWPPQRGSRPALIRAKVNETNKISIFARTSGVTVWLSPETIDFDKQIGVELNGKRIVGRNEIIRPKLSVLLEDVRTRGDRLHPFWAKVESKR